MSEPTGDWAQTVVYFLAAAERLEEHGQLNLAKLARATAEALSRRAAYALNLPRDLDDLAAELGHALGALPGLGIDEALPQAMKRGIAAQSAGRLPLFDEIPNPFVCRACGAVSMTPPAEPCAVCGAWPTTFEEIMPVYWLNALQPDGVLAALRQTPKQVAVFLNGLAEEKLARPAPDGGWSMRHVIAHLRDAQDVLNARLLLIVAEENPTLESLAVFEWATSEQGRPPTTAEIFHAYQASRRETLALLERLLPADWSRTGRHKEFGQVTILQQASYFSAHEQTHLAALTALREAARA